jgi:23S rRNA (guanosine2251-2'-O)-methyltransferase
VVCFVALVETSSVDLILSEAKSPGLLVVLDGIEDPQNLGAILRSAEIAGVDGIFLPQRRSAGLSPGAIKASAGAASHIKVARIPNAAQLIDSLKNKGYWLTGLDASAILTPWKADFTLPTALVLGNERSGLHRLIKQKCDFLVGIPMRGKTASYNVSVAAGIVLYEVIRQRSAD